MTYLVALKLFERQYYDSDWGGIQENWKYHADDLAQPIPVFLRELRLAMTGSRRLSSCIWYRTLVPAVTVYNNKIAFKTRAISLPSGGKEMRKLHSGSRSSCNIASVCANRLPLG